MNDKEPSYSFRLNCNDLSKIIVMEIPGSFIPADLRLPMSKTLNISPFGKNLTFFYRRNEEKKLLDPLLPFKAQDIDLKKSPIEIEIGFEHYGA